MISFIFPAFNEAENLRRIPTEVIPVFDALGELYEIIVVDDGSKDETASVAESLGGTVRLVKHDRNRGLGAAVRTGIASAQGDLVVTMDSDLTFAPALVKNLLARYRMNDVDCVSGSPKLAGYTSDVPRWRIWISKSASLVYRVIIGAKVADVSPIFRLYRRDHLVALPLQTTGFDINAEILFWLVRHGHRIAEIPAPLTVRIHGESKLNYPKEIKRHMRLIVRMVKMRLVGTQDTERPFVIITQTIDPNDSVLGFFCGWISSFAAELGQRPIEIWCRRAAEWPALPATVTIKPFQSRRLGLVAELYRRILQGRPIGVFVHMTPIWMALGGLFWKLRGVRTALWYTHGTKTLTLHVACLFAGIVFTATKDAFPLRSKNVRAIGHGIEDFFFEAGRSRPAYSGEGIRCLSVGRISRRKRVAESLQLFAELIKEDPQAKYRWIGEPRTDDDRSYLQDLQSLVISLGLQDRVMFSGPLAPKDLVPAYLESDLLIHLSDTGSLDKVVLESLACLCPVFSTNPATRDADEASYWGGALDAAAASEMIRRSREGVSTERQAMLYERFSLQRLIKTICTYFTDSGYVRN